MKHTRFLLYLAVMILLVSCTVGIFAVGAKAEEATVYYTVGDVQMEGAEHFEDFVPAFDAAEAKNHQWAANDVLEIRFKGDFSGGQQNGLLFGQTTIWREDGTKLPIIIRGVDTKKPRDAYIYLDAVGGWYACANDYTFINMTLPVGNQLTEFYAGSGNVRFENVNFKEDDTIISNAEEQKMLHDVIRAVAHEVSTRNNTDLVPAGDAWMDLIQNNSDIGNSLWRTEKKNRPQGDYLHDGDIGGGQYLNACVWYEVLTKKSCVGNTWRPTEEICGYTLEESMVEELQKAAHKAVSQHYGNDYYSDSYSVDTIKDNEVNILVIGSSTGYYFVDEISQMLNAQGFTARVGMAYYSGVKISTQWSWAVNQTGNYAFRLYEKNSVTANVNTATGAMFTGVGFDKFIELYDWDAIGIYETSTSYPANFYAESYENSYNACLRTCTSADNLYAFYKQTNPDSRYLWYQATIKPVGYPGSDTSLSASSGRFYGDNCTQAAFSGWPELKDGEKVQTSLTFGEGVSYTGSAVTHYVAAVGYMTDYEGAALTDATAAQVTYQAAAEGYTDVADIRPVDVEASIVLDGGTLYNVSAHLGHAPSTAKVKMYSGTVSSSIDGDNRSSSTVDYYYGDTEISVLGGEVGSCIYGTYSSHMKGDLVIEIGGDAVINSSVRGSFKTGKIDGDMRMTVSGNALIRGNNDNKHAFYGGGDATGRIINTISGGRLIGTYFGIRYGGSGKTVENNFTGGTLEGDFYGGHYETTSLGMIINRFEGGVITGNTYAGSYNENGKITGAKTVVGGKEVTASIVNYISGSTFGSVTTVDGTTTRTGDFYGSGIKGTAGDIYHIITDATFNNNFYGGNNGTLGKIYTTVQSATVGAGFHGGAYAGSCTGVDLEIFDIDVTGSLCGGGQSNSRITGKITSVIHDANVATYVMFAGLGNVVAPENFLEEYVVESTIYNGTYKGVWGGGGNPSNSLTGNIKTTIYDGTFDLYKATDSKRLSAFNAATRGAKHLSGKAEAFIYGGTFSGEVTAGSYPNSSASNHSHNDPNATAKITINGGTFNRPILANSKWGACKLGTVVLNPSKGDIVINSKMTIRTDTVGAQEYEIIGDKHKIVLGADAKIEATSASGDIKIQQKDSWKKQSYVILPAGNTANVTVSNADAAKGTFSVDKIGTSVVTVKGGVQLSAATMILTDRIAVRALFDKASIDESEDFTFSFVMNSQTLASGSKGDLELWGDEYYSIVLDKIGASDFLKTVSFTGSGDVWGTEFSVKSLAANAEDAWKGNDVYVQLAKAIQNFATVAAYPTASLPHPELKVDSSKYEDFEAIVECENGTNFKVSGKGLVMSNAVGIRIYGSSDTLVTANDFIITVNGSDVTEKAIVSAGQNENEYAIDLYVHVKSMDTPLNIVITEKSTNKVCLNLTDRVDAIAASYPETHDNYMTAQQLLVYIQAALAYAEV